MEYLIDNWYIMFAILVAGVCLGIAAYRFCKLPTAEQLEKVREWLLYAVTEAERELGGGTGKLKLRSVYDLFLQRFPWLVRVVAFEQFSWLVDDALGEMRKMLDNNKAVQALVSGDGGEG